MIWMAGLAFAAGLQRISVVVQDVPAGTTVYAAVRGGAPVRLRDEGVGSLSATFEAPAAREIQLQLLAEHGGTTRRVYDGTEVLADVHDDTLTFAWNVMSGVNRVAGAPSSVLPMRRDDATALNAGYAWAALTGFWVFGTAVVWARRRG